MEETTNNNKKIIISIVSGLALLLFILSFTVVGAGKRGVVLRLGSVNRVLDSGLHMKLPFPIETVKKMDVQIRKIETDSSAYSKDIQTVTAKIALNYHLQPESVGLLYAEIGRDYAIRLIDPAIQESVKAATAKFTAQELIEQRPKVKEEIKLILADRLQGKYITVDDFSIVNFDFSDVYETAVEAKQVAQQEALKAENDLTRIKVEANQRIAQAEAEAQAIRIQAQAITQQGGEDYVRLKAIEKWNGTLPTQFIPGMSVPFLNVIK